uniref:Uncharacterized protein n=1 Tax=Ciona intestinalis TaxID=7719 RepID=H2XXP8_CIOIN
MFAYSNGLLTLLALNHRAFKKYVPI